MKFIKLTDHAGDITFVNPNNIVLMFRDGGKATNLHLLDDDQLVVEETPEQIIELICE